MVTPLGRFRLDYPEIIGRPVLSAKQRRRREHFVKVPIEWFEQATRATATPKAFVVVWLLYRAWKMSSRTVVLSNGQLEAHGINRKTKYRALQELETAGLIKVGRRRGRGVTVTML